MAVVVGGSLALPLWCGRKRIHGAPLGRGGEASVCTQGAPLRWRGRRPFPCGGSGRAAAELCCAVLCYGGGSGGEAVAHLA